MERQFTVIVEELPIGMLRPTFVPDNKAQNSWVGEWETNTADLARQVARAFQDWTENGL